MSALTVSVPSHTHPIMKTSSAGGHGFSGVKCHSHPKLDSNTPKKRDKVMKNPRKAVKKKARVWKEGCKVCGDKVLGRNYGGLSCVTCKAFFRRSIRQEDYPNYRCVKNRNCDINIITRKGCRSCRFNKCLSIGMDINRVKPPKDKTHVSHREHVQLPDRYVTTVTYPSQQPNPICHDSSNAEICQNLSSGNVIQQNHQKNTYKTFQILSKPIATTADHVLRRESTSIVDQTLDGLKRDEWDEIKRILDAYNYANKRFPFHLTSCAGTREVVEMFSTLLRRFVFFSTLISDFAAMNRNEQENRLKANIIGMCFLRGTVYSGRDNKQLPCSPLASLKYSPRLLVTDTKHTVSPAFFGLLLALIQRMKLFKIDEAVAMLLTVIILFSSTLENIKNNDGSVQNKYIMLLKKYVLQKIGITEGSRIFSQVMNEVENLDGLNKSYMKNDIIIDQNTATIVRQLLIELQEDISSDSHVNRTMPISIPSVSEFPREALKSIASYSPSPGSPAFRPVASSLSNGINPNATLVHCSSHPSTSEPSVISFKKHLHHHTFLEQHKILCP